MLLKSSVLYPYPILWEEKDDFIKNTSFNMSLSMQTVGPKTHFYINVTLDNNELLELVKNDKVNIVCHFECPKTKYRNSEILYIGENDIIVDSNKLNGKVEVLSVLQNIIELPLYSNGDFSNFYKGITFDIPEFSILAISSRYEVYIEKEIDTLSNISSIISIIPDYTNKKNVLVELNDHNKIFIKLPEKIFVSYFSVSTSEEYNSRVFSMLVVPALMETFYYLLDQEDFGLFDDYRWFRGLRKVIKSVLNEELTYDFLKASNLFELAQKIIDNPIKDAFDKMTGR